MGSPLGLNQVGQGLVPFSSHPGMWSFPQHGEDVPSASSGLQTEGTTAPVTEIAEEREIYTQITARPHSDPNLQQSLSLADRVPAWVWKAEEDTEEGGFAVFTIDQFNVAQALASYAKFDLQFASASPNDPGLRALRQSMVHWHTFPTTFEDVNKEFGFLGYIAGGKKEDDEGAELLERDGLHRYRIQMYGEINNTPRFWSNASLAVGSKVGFMLKQVPLRVLNVPQIPRNAIDRNPTLGAMKVLQWVPWDSHVSGRFPPSNVDQLMFSQFAADTPETQEVMFKSNDVDHPLFGVPSVIGTRYQHGIVLTVGIVLRLNQLTSETAVKKALLTYEGVAELMRSNAKVDLVLDPAPAIGY